MYSHVCVAWRRSPVALPQVRPVSRLRSGRVSDAGSVSGADVSAAAPVGHLARLLAVASDDHLWQHMLILDLSSNQGRVDFARVKKAGVKAVWLKVSEGRTWDDPTFHARAAAARKAGLRVGGYHFARPDLNDPGSEAQHFARVLGKVGRRDLRPVLDFEQANDLLPSRQVSWAREFNHAFRHATGLTPVFYSYPAFIDAMRPTRPIGNGLWLASYSRNDGREHSYTIPAPWRRAVAHQFSSNATVAGVPGRVDLSSAPRLRGVLARPVAGLL